MVHDFVGAYSSFRHPIGCVHLARLCGSLFYFSPPNRVCTPCTTLWQLVPVFVIESCVYTLHDCVETCSSFRHRMVCVHLLPAIASSLRSSRFGSVTEELYESIGGRCEYVEDRPLKRAPKAQVDQTGLLSSSSRLNTTLGCYANVTGVVSG
jgi:hypothetical protein